MAKNDLTTAYLHIEDAFNNFSKDIRVTIPLLKNSNHYEVGPKEVLEGASKKVLGKYIDNIKEDTCTLTLMIPKAIDKEELIEVWENSDIEQASIDINDILSKLSPEQRKQVLNHINNIKK